MTYRVEHVGFGEMRRVKGTVTLVKFKVNAFARRKLLQLVRDGEPLVTGILLVKDVRGKAPEEITPEQIDWSSSDFIPTSQWGL